MNFLDSKNVSPVGIYPNCPIFHGLFKILGFLSCSRISLFYNAVLIFPFSVRTFPPHRIPPTPDLGDMYFIVFLFCILS